MSAGIPNLKWPRSIEESAQLAELDKIFSKDFRPLWQGGTLKVAHPKISKAFKELLPYLHVRQQLSRGLENIERTLYSEKRGQDALLKKEKREAAFRVSRLLLIGASGSERFYRQCEKLLLEHSDRVSGLGLDEKSSEIMENLYGEGALAKALLISHKDAVAEALLALVSV